MLKKKSIALPINASGPVSSHYAGRPSLLPRSKTFDGLFLGVGLAPADAARGAGGPHLALGRQPKEWPETAPARRQEASKWRG